MVVALLTAKEAELARGSRHGSSRNSERTATPRRAASVATAAATPAPADAPATWIADESSPIDAARLASQMYSSAVAPSRGAAGNGCSGARRYSTLSHATCWVARSMRTSQRVLSALGAEQPWAPRPPSRPARRQTWRHANRAPSRACTLRRGTTEPLEAACRRCQVDGTVAPREWSRRRATSEAA